MLSAAGHEVEVLGMNTLPHLVEEDIQLVRGRKWKYTAVPGPLDPLNQGKTFRYRVSRRMANELAARTGIQTAAQLGGWRRDFLIEALARNADLTVAHSAVTLWVVRELMRRGRKVAVDFEDWFSREHEKAPWHPDKVIAKLEKEVLAGASHATCTSEAMAEAIGKAYGRKPEVVYNVFPLAGAPKPAPEPGPDGPKVLWISQALGPGRGLETLVEALQFCEPKFGVTLTGNPQGNYQADLKTRIPAVWRNRVFFQKQVKDQEVLAHIAKHHIGLALEVRSPEARDLTVSNKMMQYLLCGLAVVATETKGQTEIAQQAESAVRLVRQGNAKGLAEILIAWSNDKSKLAVSREQARKKAKERFCFEKEEGRIRAFFQKDISQSGHSRA